jgi:acetylornithine deacetylase
MNLQRLLRHLKALIAFDTQNPPRQFHADSLLFEYLATALGRAFEVTVTDHGKGRISFLAVRGAPHRLFNAHLDTVPAIAGSLYPPLEMNVSEGRVYGRGACDIKGAAACLLTVAQTSDESLAMLFTTDEEGGEGCCVEQFVATGACKPFGHVVVCEPTQCKVELVHRGYLSVTGQFTGHAGHSSERRGLEQSALHRMVRWSAAAIKQAGRDSEEGLRSCFNIGTMSGGVKSNVIADQAQLHWSARLLPGQSNDEFLARMQKLDAAEFASWNVPFAGPPLPTEDREPLDADLLQGVPGLEIGSGLDFWTEASLFSRAGIPALVFGPGNIEQAHTVDEWVSLAQLEQAMTLFTSMVRQHA